MDDLNQIALADLREEVRKLKTEVEVYAIKLGKLRGYVEAQPCSCANAIYYGDRFGRCPRCGILHEVNCGTERQVVHNG